MKGIGVFVICGAAWAAPLAPLAPLAAQAAQAAREPLVPLNYRMLGPHRGGRATAVTGIAEQPHVFFMGTTGGGVWKTDDAGAHWRNITDGFLDVGNIGALDVADSDPNVIWVGTGSASIRGNSSVGTGVWRSTDGGRTWTFRGLRESGAIGELLVHPRDPNTVWVAALGHPFGRNAERGVFRTTDGGATWQHVLSLDDSTGVVSLALNPSDPRELYAGAWRAERKPWTMISGGPAGGVYKSTDGGDRWTKLGGGLPTGIVGKVGLTISAARPDRVFALVEHATQGGLYRSEDRGGTWTRVSDDSRVRARPFYYSHVVADPTDADKVWVLNTPLLRSIDGGRTFTQLPVPHGDTHDLWINPTNPQIFALSDDGGTVVTLNGGRTFSTMYNQPTAELYDVVVDNQHPYRVYGSQQDNSSISVPSRRLGNSLRPQQEWGYAAGCETGPVALHPDHPTLIFGGCYGGALNRYDVTRDSRVSVGVGLESQQAAPRALRDRWQWVAPIVVSPHDPRTVYHASQYLYASRDAGDTWTRISPDLSRNDTTVQRWAGGPITPDNTGVEMFGTIFSVVPSTHDARTLWVGTDDGRVHLTRDHGETWREITPPGMPPFATVNRIEVSAHAPGRAFVAVHRYRMDDFTPYIWRTDDFGRSWTRLGAGPNGLPPRHFVRVVREDPERKGLLYAGTEFGLYVSLNDGVSWRSLQGRLPSSPITDLKVHRGDLVISTQGRSFWVLDDLTPLREFAADSTARAVRLFTPRPAERGTIGVPLQEVDLLLPEDRPFGASLHYTLAQAQPGLVLEVRDASGRVVRTWRADSALPTGQQAPSTAGVHRVVWDLRGPGPRSARDPLGAGGRGVKMPPGQYTVRLTAGGVMQERPLVVVPNPTAGHSQADYDAQYALSVAVRDTMSALTGTLDALRTVRAGAQQLKTRAGGAAAVTALADSLVLAVDAIDRASGPASATGPVVPAGLAVQYQTLYGTLVGDGGYGSGSAEGRPSAARVARERELAGQWVTMRAQADAVLGPLLDRLNAAAAQAGVAVVPRPPR
jgi:photosystem II stability/assembly factor-like uncharacterized protein